MFGFMMNLRFTIPDIRGLYNALLGGWFIVTKEEKLWIICLSKV